MKIEQVVGVHILTNILPVVEDGPIVSSFVDVGREAERGVKGELPPPPPLEQYKSDIIYFRKFVGNFSCQTVHDFLEI